MVLVFGMTVVGCDNGAGGENGGNLTLTGIPSEHNGRYAFFGCFGNHSLYYFAGVMSFNFQNDTATLPRISGGNVTIPIWVSDGSDDHLVRFTGNANDVEAVVYIFTNAEITIDDLNDYSVHVLRIDFQNIDFRNGNASITWASGTVR